MTMHLLKIGSKAVSIQAGTLANVSRATGLVLGQNQAESSTWRGLCELRLLPAGHVRGTYRPLQSPAGQCACLCLPQLPLGLCKESPKLLEALFSRSRVLHS